MSRSERSTSPPISTNAMRKNSLTLANARIAILTDGVLVASTLTPAIAATVRVRVAEPSIRRHAHARRRVVCVPPVRGCRRHDVLRAWLDRRVVARRRPETAVRELAVIAAGAIALALAASFWVARMLTEPVGRLSESLAPDEHLARRARPPAARRVEPRAGCVDRDVQRLMASVAKAEEQTQAAYMGAIRALATALDARDPYTAGHSDRVSVLSVAIGGRSACRRTSIEIIRLGALLHDIGKIGVPDAVLLKPGSLTDVEFDIIKQHPVAGARILRSVPFLLPHIPIVELHHERPDGRGYPHGLRGDDIPMAARIVHVADAYDAITRSVPIGARARPARRCTSSGASPAPNFTPRSSARLRRRSRASCRSASEMLVETGACVRPPPLCCFCSARRRQPRRRSTSASASTRRSASTHFGATTSRTARRSSSTSSARRSWEKGGSCTSGPGSGRRVRRHRRARRPAGTRRFTRPACATSEPDRWRRESTPATSRRRSASGSSIRTRKQNPMISGHSSYFVPMLPFDTNGARVPAIASTYPLGALLTISTNHWDARARDRQLFTSSNFHSGRLREPRSTPVFEGGAGVTPLIGIAPRRRRSRAVPT